MNESPVAREWRAEAYREGRLEARIEAKLEGKVELLVEVLRRRLAPVPKDLVDRLNACTHRDPFDRWLDSALTAKTIEDFRRDTGL
jgi:hypothetical protein